jgi:hypothetical protein
VPRFSGRCPTLPLPVAPPYLTAIQARRRAGSSTGDHTGSGFPLVDRAGPPAEQGTAAPIRWVNRFQVSDLPGLGLRLLPPGTPTTAGAFAGDSVYEDRVELFAFLGDRLAEVVLAGVVELLCCSHGDRAESHFISLAAGFVALPEVELGIR